MNLTKQISAWLPVLAWGYLIFHFSSGTVPVASSVYWQDFAVKKTGHVLLFGAMALLIYRGFLINGVKKTDAAIYSIFLAFFYGATDEFHQMYTQGRESRVRDIFIDGVGAVLSVSSFYYLPQKLSKKMYNLIEKLGVV